MDRILVFQLGWGPLNYLLNSCLGFTHNGDSGTTSYWRLGKLGVVTVRGRQVNAQYTVVAESLGMVTLLFHFSELPIHSNLGTNIAISWFW